VEPSASVRQGARSLNHYRAIVDEIHVLLTESSRPLLPATAESVLRSRLQEPAARAVLDRVEGGIDALVRQARDEVSRFVATSASNAKTPESLVRILLLQQIDLAWWSGASDFSTTADIKACASLVDLVDLREGGHLRFDFSVASDRLLPRARNLAVRRCFPRRRPHAAGVSSTSIRPEMVVVLNALAREFAAVAPARTPPLWVNSVMRSLQQQQHLRDLGYSALSPSAHCRGWAADIEMHWFARFDAQDALRGVLIGRRDRGELNVIDEGRAWHVCPNPEALQTAFTVVG